MKKFVMILGIISSISGSLIWAGEAENEIEEELPFDAETEMITGNPLFGSDADEYGTRDTEEERMHHIKKIKY